MYTGGIYVIKLLRVFLLSIYLLLEGEGLSQEPRKGEEKLFFSPTQDLDLSSAFAPWVDIFCLCIKRLQVWLSQNTGRV